MRLLTGQSSTTFVASKLTGMKPNLALTFYYLIYFGVAVFLQPAKNSSISVLNYQKIQKEEIPVAQQQTEILHSELLFKY